MTLSVESTVRPLAAADRAVALSVVAEALDQSLEIAGRWQHDVHALDWHAPVRAID